MAKRIVPSVAAKKPGVKDYVARRAALMRELNGAIGLVFAGEGGGHLHGQWEADRSFYYLTGIGDEPGAAVLFDPSSSDPRRRCILFLRPRDPEMEMWDGHRDAIGSALKARTGFDTVLRTRALPNVLATLTRQRKRLATLHQPTLHTAAVPPDLALFRQLCERTAGVTIEDRTGLLPSMRAIKSPVELAAISRAIDATLAGHRAAAAAMKPGANERDVQESLERAMRDAGGDGTAYNSIVGAGRNAAVLHYVRNNAPIEPGDLVLIDAAASVDGYAADITRTYPASGRFSPEQLDVYRTVLRAQRAAIAVVKPGNHLWQADEAAREIIDKAGFADAFYHGIGHPLGLEVHDVASDGALRAGMVVTIEPGIYVEERRLGIRLEDDILVMPRGSRNLSAHIPIEPKDVEGLVRGR